jgi:hypothetical protein
VITFIITARLKRLMKWVSVLKGAGGPGPHRIGAKYLKARCVEYTDATFTTRKVRTGRLGEGANLEC